MDQVFEMHEAQCWTQLVRDFLAAWLGNTRSTDVCREISVWSVLHSEDIIVARLELDLQRKPRLEATTDAFISNSDIYFHANLCLDFRRNSMLILSRWNYIFQEIVNSTINYISRVTEWLKLKGSRIKYVDLKYITPPTSSLLLQKLSHQSVEAVDITPSAWFSVWISR